MEAVAGALYAKLAKFDLDKPATFFHRAAAAQAGAWGLLQPRVTFRHSISNYNKQYIFLRTKFHGYKIGYEK